MRVAAISSTADYLALVRRRRAYGGVLMALFIVLMAAGWRTADARNAGSFADGIRHVFDFPAEILSEAARDWANLPGYLRQYLPSLIETLNIAAVSTLLGGVFACILAILSARALAPVAAIVTPIRRLMDVMRAMPEIVIALVLIFLLGGGPVPAMIAITLHTAGALGKLFSEAAENADLKPLEGLASVGAGWLARIWFGILPQVAPNWSSYALLRFEINIRASAILGFVGAGGIGYDLRTTLQWGQGRYDQVVAIFVLLFLTIVAVDALSDRARRRLVKGGAAA